MSSPLKIIIVEDNPEYRRVVKMALDRSPQFELVGKFGTAEQALRELETQPTLADVDVLLLDLNLPKMSGLEALPWIKKYAPKIKVLVLTQSDDRDDILGAIQHGAVGYLLKSSTVSQIHEGILTVSEGGASLDSSVASHILTTLQKRIPAPSEQSLLSNRENDVLVLLGEGLVKKEIAERLEISSHTVATHVRHIYEKLDVLNAPSAISTAYKKGLLPLDKPDSK